MLSKHQKKVMNFKRRKISKKSNANIYVRNKEAVTGIV